MDKDTKDFLLALYSKLWDNINNKDSRLWTFLSVYGGGVALVFTVGKLANVELYSVCVILVLTLWALSIVANATWWSLRNRLMIQGIENRFPGAKPGVIPSAYGTIRPPKMDKLSKASVFVLATVALVIYLRTTWPFLRAGSVTNGEVLVSLVLLYFLSGAAVFWWVERIDEMVREYYSTARSLDTQPAPAAPDPQTPAMLSLEAAARAAALGVLRQARTAAAGQPVADQLTANSVAEAIDAAVANAATQARDAQAQNLLNLFQTTATAAAAAIQQAADLAAGANPGPGAGAVQAAVAGAVAPSAAAGVAQELARTAPPIFSEDERGARAIVGWRFRGLALLIIVTIIFDGICWANGPVRWLTQVGIICQALAGVLYIWWAVCYYYSKGTEPTGYRLSFYGEPPAQIWSLRANGGPTLILTLFVAGGLLSAASILSPPNGVSWTSGSPTSITEIKTEHERLTEQLEALRKRSAELVDVQRQQELAAFLNRNEAERFLTKDEAEKLFAPKADLEAVRRDLSQKKGP